MIKILLKFEDKSRHEFRAYFCQIVTDFEVCKVLSFGFRRCISVISCVAVTYVPGSAAIVLLFLSLICGRKILVLPPPELMAGIARVTAAQVSRAKLTSQVASLKMTII